MKTFLFSFARMLALFLWSLLGTAHAEIVVKIGLAGPLTGPQAHLGKDNENGAELAVETLNAKPRKLGGNGVKFQLVSVDDAADPRIGTQMAHQLVDAKVNAVIGHFNSGVTIPASKIYAEAQVPQISISTNPAYLRQGIKTAFRLLGNDIHLGKVLGDYIIRELQARAIVVIDDRTAYGQGLADEFVKSVQASGGKIKAREYTNDKASDFMTLLTRLKQYKPDIVFYGGTDAQAAPLARQMRLLGFNAKLIGGDMVKTEKFLALAGPAAAENQYAAVAGAPLDKQAGGLSFLKRYEAKFHRRPEVYASSFYDAVMLIAEAMQQAQSPEPRLYLPKLKSIQYAGVAAHYSFDELGELKQAPVSIYRVQKGQWKLVNNR